MGCRNILPYSNGEVIIEGMFNNTLIIKEYGYYSSQIFLLNNMGKCRNKKEEKQEFILSLTEGFQDDEKQNEYYLNLMKNILS